MEQIYCDGDMGFWMKNFTADDLDNLKSILKFADMPLVLEVFLGFHFILFVVQSGDTKTSILN